MIARGRRPAGLSVAISRHVALCPRGRILSQKLVRKAKTLEDRGHHESGDLFHAARARAVRPQPRAVTRALGHRPCPSDNDDRPARSQVANRLTELIGDELSAGRLPGDTPGDELAVFAIPALEPRPVPRHPLQRSGSPTSCSRPFAPAHPGEFGRREHRPESVCARA
jgi:hypothetical protein